MKFHKVRHPDRPIIVAPGRFTPELARKLKRLGLSGVVSQERRRRWRWDGRQVSISVQDLLSWNQTEGRLRRSEKQLHALNARLQHIREEERTRIAREVHDVLGQLLTGLTLDMAWLRRKLIKLPESELQAAMLDKLIEVKQLTDLMSRTVQEIASEMRPSALDNLGLCAAIRFEAGRFRKRTGIECQVDVAEPGDLPALSPESATGVFRIYQEILTNVARHAGATQVHIRLNLEGGRLELGVIDNGCGITREQLESPSSLGLLGMRERAEQLGGRLHIRGTPGLGAEVILEAPL